MAVRTMQRPGKGRTSVSKNKEEPKETEESVGVLLPAGEAAHVGISMSYTKNLGNFESTKITVDLHMPCVPDAIDPTFDKMRTWVDGHLAALVAEIDE